VDTTSRVSEEYLVGYIKHGMGGNIYRIVNSKYFGGKGINIVIAQSLYVYFGRRQNYKGNYCTFLRCSGVSS
jgi:N-dimethylarginine dimethylaminohydrolase